ncbi:hypothetical protein GWK47_017294 [Chionoecetes opilio]|uniref:Uncharacterized protein n=1 Tax=Chionoecetes opilio TaxID=41210 RepID=A0A8J4XU01_CHIOP|nr:hypothetical protein GWK47_017294 [Chionoecetes opilio]
MRIQRGHYPARRLTASSAAYAHSARPLPRQMPYCVLRPMRIQRGYCPFRRLTVSSAALCAVLSFDPGQHSARLAHPAGIPALDTGHFSQEANARPPTTPLIHTSATPVPSTLTHTSTPPATLPLEKLWTLLVPQQLRQQSLKVRPPLFVRGIKRKRRVLVQRTSRQTSSLLRLHDKRPQHSRRQHCHGGNTATPRDPQPAAPLPWRQHCHARDSLPAAPLPWR